MVPTFAFEPHKGFGPAILGSPREDARAAMALASTGQIMTLWQADTQYDYLGSESRLVWAQVGLGNERYLASISKILRRS